MKAHISTLLAIVVLAVSLLPALHVFNHEFSSESETAGIHEFSKEAVDCEMCDFRLATSDAPTIYSYEIVSLQKETVYSLSLAETVTLFPKPYFSLRAPPVVIS